MRRAPETLDDLAELLRTGTVAEREWVRLPTFGGAEPRTGTARVWSWDADRLLVSTGTGDLAIVARADWSGWEA